MKTYQFVLSGLGGQGILFMTKILAQTALNKKFNILGAETHGMAQRGGSVVSHLKIGDAGASLIRAGAGDCLISMDEAEAYRYLPWVKPGGVIFANAPAETFPDARVTPYLDTHQITGFAMEAGRIAFELGSPKSTNLAMVAFFTAFDLGPLDAYALRETVKSMSPDPVKKINLKIFDTCHEQGKKSAERSAHGFV